MTTRAVPQAMPVQWGLRSPAAFAYLREMVGRTSGIVLNDDKNYLFVARLTPLLQTHGLGSLDDLVGLLKAGNRALQDRVVELMSTNETSFFRDGSPFEALRTAILPELAARRAGVRKLRLWSAACSTGQEAYSLAITIADSGLFQGWDVQILGTDLSPGVVDRARAGVYAPHEVARGLSPATVARHFVQEPDGTCRAGEALRRMVDFRVMNLMGAWLGLPPFDVVFLRNVLIYFDVPTKEQVLERMVGVLQSDGYLFLGSVETVLNVRTNFAEMHVDRVTCLRPAGPGR